MSEVLIVEDDKLLCSTLKELLSRKKLNVFSCSSIAKARQLLIDAIQVDIVLLDINLPDGDGLKFISEFKNIVPRPEVIIMTGQGNPDMAELAVRNGAWSYLDKSNLIHRLPQLIDSALEYHKEKQVTFRTDETLKCSNIVGSCRPIKKCLQLAYQASRSNINVLLTGESGTGKEVFAQAIHKNSQQRNKKLVIVDCAALPETLAESILFGHSKGAFTDAKTSKPGLIQEADGGTLFLDEVGELPANLQKSFLRVLQERSFRPIGHPVEIKSDFRLIAATNKNLAAMVKKGKFRNDLYYRIQSFIIDLPPLRKRENDIMKLANYFLIKILGSESDVNRKNFSHEFIEIIKTYSWPGNVRELFHALEKAVASSQLFSTLYAQHLPKEIRAKAVRSNVQNNTSYLSPKKNVQLQSTLTSNWKSYKIEMEKKYMEELLAVAKRSIPEACQIAGISRARLYQLINKYSAEK